MCQNNFGHISDMFRTRNWLSMLNGRKFRETVNGLPEPVFKEEAGGFTVILRKFKTPEELEILGLNERQLKAIAYLKDNKKITRKEYASLFNCSIRTAFNDIQEMIDKHILQRKGRGRYTYYEPI